MPTPKKSQKHPRKTLPGHISHHLKRWLVPHKQNDHRPHLIRVHGLALTALLVLGVQASGYALSSAPTPLVKGGHVLSYASGSITPVELLTLTNQDRAAAGLPALQMDSRLNQSSQLKAANMFSEDYWNHVSPSCIQPWHWFTVAGYTYTFAGENLAKDFDTSAGVNDGWMNSPGHKANILNPNYTDVGFAVVNGDLPVLANGQVTPSCATPGAQTNGQTTLVVAHYGATAHPVAAATPSTHRPVVASAATPEPTPVPTPVPTVTPAVTPTPTPAASASQKSSHAAIGQGSVGPSAPAAQGFSIFRPLSMVKTLNWNTLVTIVILLILLLVYVVTHLTVWNRGLARWHSRHYRLFAAAQLSGLSIAIIVLASSGFGQVG